jgi:serine/threonine-protein kinase
VDQVILKALSKEPNLRYPDAIAFGADLARLRRHFAPAVTEQELGEALSASFVSERQADDAVLEATLRGKAAPPVRSDRSRRVTFVPPTALAFEHKAQQAPNETDFAIDEVTEPGARKPTPSATRVTRVGFGVTFEAQAARLEDSLIEEIEGSDEQEAYHTTDYDTSGRQRFAVQAVLAFLSAVGVGFLGIWVWFAWRG